MLTKIFVDQPYDGDADANKPEQSFRDVSTIVEYWNYLRKPFLDNIYGNGSSDKNNSSPPPPTSGTLSVNPENILMGPPRLRQLRVSQRSCSIHEVFQRNFFHCYGEYSMGNMDTEPFGLATGTA